MDQIETWERIRRQTLPVDVTRVSLLSSVDENVSNSKSLFSYRLTSICSVKRIFSFVAHLSNNHNSIRNLYDRFHCFRLIDLLFSMSNGSKTCVIISCSLCHFVVSLIGRRCKQSSLFLLDSTGSLSVVVILSFLSKLLIISQMKKHRNRYSAFVNHQLNVSLDRVNGRFD